MEIIDPTATFEAAKKAADEARAVLVAEEGKLRAEDKTRRADFKAKIAAIHKLLGRKPRENGKAAKPKPGVEQAQQK